MFAPCASSASIPLFPLDGAGQPHSRCEAGVCFVCIRRHQTSTFCVYQAPSNQHSAPELIACGNLSLARSPGKEKLYGATGGGCRVGGEKMLWGCMQCPAYFDGGFALKSRMVGGTGARCSRLSPSTHTQMQRGTLRCQGGGGGRQQCRAGEAPCTHDYSISERWRMSTYLPAAA